MTSIGILGSTGSIGTQTIDVINSLPGDFNIKYLTSYQNEALLAEQAIKYNPDTICIVNDHNKSNLKKLLIGKNINIVSGRKALLELAGRNDIDLVMNGLVGASGMEPTINAIRAGVNVALSNKESLVMAGAIINRGLKDNNVQLYPVDSEHSAIWQCLAGEKKRTN